MLILNYCILWIVICFFLKDVTDRQPEDRTKTRTERPAEINDISKDGKPIYVLHTKQIRLSMLKMINILYTWLFLGHTDMYTVLGYKSSSLEGNHSIRLFYYFIYINA